MLDAISNLVRNVTIIVIIAGFLEMLLPSGEIKRFVKAVLGLFILVSMLNPLLGLFDKNVVSEVLAWQDPMESSELSTILGQGEKISQEMNEKALEMYRKNLAKQIETVVKLIKGVAWVEADVQMAINNSNLNYEAIDKVVLVVGMIGNEGEKEGIDKIEPIKVEISGPKNNFSENPDQKEMEEQIKDSLKNFFGLREEQIDILMMSQQEEEIKSGQ
ncbi:MAG: stage III sporulation protein AF [Dehalobacterium sp.]